jgi:L-ascorbate metabolism protein UlaG (beta-lactamase superfamily)
MREFPPLEEDQGSILFIGTATVLIRFGGFTVLTDPSFVHRNEVIRLGYGVRARRLTDPALQLDELPPLDLVVLSHLHEDHFDRVAEAELPRELPVVTTPHAAQHLTKRGFSDTRPTRTWETRRLDRGRGTLEVTAMPAKHAPHVIERLLPPVMGSMLDFSIDGERRLRLYISGDTLVHDALREIPRRFSDVDLALLHLGGARVAGVLLSMDGRQGIEALQIVRPKLAIPVHYDDYPLFKSPLSEFAREAERTGWAPRVHYLAHGETFAFSVARPTLPTPAPAPAPNLA